VVGRRPPARFGHTATNLPGSSGKLLVVGGRDHLHGGAREAPLWGAFTGLHILDTERRSWTQQSFSGTPPAQAFYHSACVLDDHTVLFLESGTGTADSSLGGALPDAVPLHLLDLESWRWSRPRPAGVGPAPRVGHAAAAAGSRVYLFGGVVRRGGQAVVDKAVYVLEAPQKQRSDVEDKEEVAGSGKTGERGRSEMRSGRSDVKVEANANSGDHGDDGAKLRTAALPSEGLAAAATAGAAGKVCSGTSGTGQGICPQEAVAAAAAAAACDAAGVGTMATMGSRAHGPQNSRDERIEMMLRESSFDGEMDDATELSFEELLEQEKAFFKAQSEKLSFRRAKDVKDGPSNGKKNARC